MGYSAEEEAEMYDSSFFYENLKVPTVAMDKDLQFHIVKQARAQSVKEGTGYSEGSYSLLPVDVPQNHKRFTCDLTQADRLALYDYVVEETKKQRSRSQITENDSDLFVDLAAKITQGLKNDLLLNLWLRTFSLSSYMSFVESQTELVVLFFARGRAHCSQSHSKDLALQNGNLVSFMMFSFWESLSALLLAHVCISVDGSSVFAAADFRLLNVANLLCSSEQLFSVRDYEIKDFLRVKDEQERLAVIQVGLLSNILWCWSEASHPCRVMPVCNCTKCSKSICVTLQAPLCLEGETVLVIYTDDSQKGPKSHLEILAEMRDYKRRRQSYRAKNVHITKKSYTEVIRDVIGVHMEELSNQWQEENRMDNAEICEGGKSKSSGRREDRRSASVDSRQSGGSSKDTECTRHRRDTSRSPSKRRRSRERGKDRDSRRKRERDEDKYHNHKRRK